MPFAYDCKTRHEDNEEKEDKCNHSVWVANSGPGLEKHQCTLPIWVSQERKVRMDIIFQGMGKKVSNKEIEAYQPRVHI